MDDNGTLKSKDKINVSSKLEKEPNILTEAERKNLQDERKRLRRELEHLSKTAPNWKADWDRFIEIDQILETDFSKRFDPEKIKQDIKEISHEIDQIWHGRDTKYYK